MTISTLWGTFPACCEDSSQGHFSSSFCLTALFWKIREFTSRDEGYFMPAALCVQEDFQICLIYKYKHSLTVEKACQEILEREKLLRQGDSNAVFQLTIHLCCLILFSSPQLSHILLLKKTQPNNKKSVFSPCEPNAHMLVFSL